MSWRRSVMAFAEGVMLTGWPRGLYLCGAG